MMLLGNEMTRLLVMVIRHERLVCVEIWKNGVVNGPMVAHPGGALFFDSKAYSVYTRSIISITFVDFYPSWSHGFYLV